MVFKISNSDKAENLVDLSEDQVIVNLYICFERVYIMQIILTSVP